MKLNFLDNEGFLLNKLILFIFNPYFHFLTVWQKVQISVLNSIFYILDDN